MPLQIDNHEVRIYNLRNIWAAFIDNWPTPATGNSEEAAILAASEMIKDNTVKSSYFC